MIGAIFPSLESDLFGGLLEVFQLAVADAGYTIVVASTEYDEAQEAIHVRNLLQCGVDALLLVGGHRTRSATNMLTRGTTPA